MRWYLTQYRAEPGRKATFADCRGSYCSYIYASSVRSARAKAKARGIGEIVGYGDKRHRGPWFGSRPYLYPSELLLRRKVDPAAVFHAATFLSYLLANCKRHRGGRLDHSKMLLGDEGLLHQLAHCLHLHTPGRRRMAETLRYFEHKVPGYTDD